MNAELSANNFRYVPNFITKDEVKELSKLFIELEKSGVSLPSDSQAPNSPAIYNFLPFVKFLVKKVPLVSELSGEELLPTYTYARIYKNKEILQSHTDRDACEISVSVNLFGDAEWPFCIKKPDNTSVSLKLNPGDGVLYLGCAAEHWRDPYQGSDFGQVFFHYVNANGNKAFTFFDKRQQ